MSQTLQHNFQELPLSLKYFVTEGENNKRNSFYFDWIAEHNISVKIFLAKQQRKSPLGNQNGYTKKRTIQ
jgi:hypothetical protein